MRGLHAHLQRRSVTSIFAWQLRNCIPRLVGGRLGLCKGAAAGIKAQQLPAALRGCLLIALLPRPHILHADIHHATWQPQPGGILGDQPWRQPRHQQLQQQVVWHHLPHL